MKEECQGMRKQSHGGHTCIPTFGLCLWSLDYSVKFSRSGWKQDRSPVVPGFESPEGFPASCSGHLTLTSVCSQLWDSLFISMG